MTGTDTEDSSKLNVTGSTVAAVVDPDAFDKVDERGALGDKSHFVDDYNDGMRESIGDKYDYIIRQIPKFDKEVGVVFDFGCGDGELLKLMGARDKKKGITRNYIGYDLAPEMVDAAKKNFDNPRALFTDSLEEARKSVLEARKTGKKSVVVLSSVIHEVVHYQSPEQQEEFWKAIWETGADYVAIRDFAVPEKLATDQTSLRVLNQIHRAFADRTYPEGHPLAGRNVLDVWQNGFEPIPDAPAAFAKGFKGWGPLENKLSSTHFLMSYDRLRIDAKDEATQERGIREMQENYTSMPFGKLLNNIPKIYQPLYCERGVTNGRADKLESVFNVDVKKDDIPPFKAKIVLKRDTNYREETCDQYHTRFSFRAGLAAAELRDKYHIDINKPQAEGPFGGTQGWYKGDEHPGHIGWLKSLVRAGIEDSTHGQRIQTGSQGHTLH